MDNQIKGPRSSEHPPVEHPNQFHSPAEAHTHMLILYNRMQQKMDRLKTDMSFLLMNIEKDNFSDAYPPHKKHAMQELTYLANMSNQLSLDASMLWTMAMQLHLTLEDSEENGNVRR